MALYAISDLHLALNTDKPMDIFGEKWRNHHEKIKENWNNKITEEEQNRMLIEGFYLKNRNPKLDEIFTGVYIINNIFIWIKSKFDTEKDILSIIVKLPYE